MLQWASSLRTCGRTSLGHRPQFSFFSRARAFDENRKLVHLEIIFLKKLDYCNNPLEARWSLGGTQIWIYRKSEPRLYLSNNYFVNVFFFPLYSTHVPWGISLRPTQRWLRFLAPCIIKWPGLGLESPACKDSSVVCPVQTGHIS